MKLWIKEILVWCLAFSRRWIPTKIAHRLASAFVKGCENYSFNFRLNGEARLLQTLGRKQRILTVLDVGANHGEWALLARAAFPEAKIHCFELAPPTFEILKKNIASTPGIFLNPFGLGEAAAEIEFHYAQGHDGHSTLISEDMDPGHFVKMKGRVESGSDYLRRQGLERIDFLKIDVEGAEYLVLRGLETDLRAGKISVIQFEYGKGSIFSKFLLRDYYDFLSACGYRIGKVFPQGVEFREYQLEHENFLGSNFVAIHRSFDPSSLS